MNDIKDKLVSLVFPRRCPVCDRAVKPFGALACRECETKVRYVKEPVCFKCGKPLEDDTKEYCFDCEHTRHSYDRGYALFEYKSVADSIYRFKYKGRQEYAAWYGDRICERLGNVIRSINPDAIIPVPIHKSKMRTRGYNQAGLIAHEISKRLSIPVYDDLVIRDKKTAPLKEYTPAERNNILRGAFKITANDVQLKTIIIVDDIYTTGATIDEVSEALRGIGARKIYFITLAIGKGL